MYSIFIKKKLNEQQDYIHLYFVYYMFNCPVYVWAEYIF